MHIPENYLSPSTCAVMGAAMLPVWLLAVQKVKREIPREKMPLLGIGAAFSFLGMMFNVPLPGGTTGHAVGATLLAIMFGPWSACLAVSVALFVQALFFGDGGILAFGANCFNMAFVMPFAGWSLYRLLKGMFPGHELLAAGVGSYVGINLAALCAAIEFGLQPMLFTDATGQALYCPYPLSISIPAMMAGHLTLFGLAETVFTLAILGYLQKTAPGLWESSRAGAGKPVYGLLALLIAATPLGLLATGTAWGEWDAEELAEQEFLGAPLGYTPAGMEEGFSFESLFPDYAIGGLPESFGYILSAIIGVSLVVLAFKAAGSFFKGHTDYGTTMESH